MAVRQPSALRQRARGPTSSPKKLLIKEADVYAAFLAYADHEISRVVQTLEDMAK